MIEHKRTVNLLQVLNPSTFAKVNNKIYGGSGRILGPSKNAESTLLAEDKLLKTVLPTVIGLNSNSADWQNKIQNYLHAFEIDVLKGGKNLDIGLIVNIKDSDLIANIKDLAKTLKIKIEKDEDLLSALTSFDATGNRFVSEMDFYKYVKFSNNIEYFGYVYCLHHNRVANNESLVKKSANIDFYLVTAIDIRNEKRKRYSMEQALKKTMIKIDGDTALANAMYSVLDITVGDDLDKAIALNEMSKVAPRKVMLAAEDKNIMLRASIEEYIRKGILKRMVNSSMIIDSNDGTLIIGNNNDEAVTFFSNAKNEALLTQFAARYKSL